MKAPLPDNEAERLAALRSLNILDTAPEEAFDELTALAASICKAPVALISLVDADRQWFKSRYGWAAAETTRDSSFCAHTILRTDLLIVPDARADPRFADSMLVTSNPQFRFYAGAPLVVPGGKALGTLCVMDHEPRELTDEQARALRILSHQVTGLLRLRWNLAELTRLNQERSSAEDGVREERNRLTDLLEHLPAMVYGLNAEGRFCLWNRECERVLGFSKEEILGRTRLELFERMYPDATYRNGLLARIADNRYRDLETTIMAADGGMRVCSWSNFSADVQIPGLPVWGVGMDVTDRRRAEDELRQAKEAAEAASRAKDEFLANVSHEIRTPMNAILGMAELALDTSLTDEQRSYLTVVNSSANALLSVINDVLDFAKIEAGKIDLEFTDFSLRGVLNESLRALALRAHSKGLELLCHLNPDVSDGLIGDPGRLRQVLLNLVGNAIKFTEEGEVVVRVSQAASDLAATAAQPPTTVELSFEVSDTGIGIPHEKQQTIFQAFEQGDNSTTRRYGGTGLGLSIASRLVALMDGAISVESEPGRGSTFRFSARFGAQPHVAPASRHPSLVDLHGLRVLVVDDNAANRLILEEWLRGWQVEPTAVGDGLTALNVLWRAVALGRPYGLALLDRRMPGVDGLALAAEIAQSPQLAECPVILLTSEDRPEGVTRQRELGIAAVARKPLQEEELLESVLRVLSRSRRAQARQGATTPRQDEASPCPRPLRVLVAEDNALNQQVVGHLLARRGHNVQIARNGREALDVLERGGIDLLLLDVHMPELDGFRVIETLRRRERGTGRHLPVVALTARSMKGDRERCLEAGMDDYLAKPIRRKELVAAIDRVLAGAPPAESPPSGHVPPALDFLDPTVLLAACDADSALLEQMIAVFQADALRHLGRLGAVLRGGTAAEVREAAHKLRGLVSAFSPAAAEVAGLLEEAGATGLLNGADGPYGTLAAMIEELVPLVARLSVPELRSRVERSSR
jgi:PAS domain S-box-containing protein